MESTAPPCNVIWRRVQRIAAGALPNTQNNLSAWIADPQKFKPGSAACRRSS